MGKKLPTTIVPPGRSRRGATRHHPHLILALAGNTRGPAMSAVIWYYAKGGQRFGPFSAPQLRQLADAGTLQPPDMVWQGGTPSWLPASSVQGLFAESSAP